MTVATKWTIDAETYRDDFPVLQRTTDAGRRLVYLDNAASSQHPQAVIDAVSDCYRNYYANVHRGIHTLSEESTFRYERARKRTAKFINAASDREVIFTSGTTAAINLVAHGYGNQHLGPGDAVLLLISEHHANIVPWQQLSERTGAQVEFVPIDDAFLIEDEVIAEHLEKYRPKVFAFAATSNVLGTEFPVTRWTQMARQFGAMVLIDAAQAVPHEAVNVQAWDADFVVFSGHKVCGPSGIGVLHGKESLLDSMPPFLGGGAMIDRVTVDGFTTAALPEKFEAGTPPIAQAIGLEAAIDYVSDIGMENIHAYESELGAEADRALRQIEGVRIIGPTVPHKAGIVSFLMDEVHPHDLSQWLDTRGIAVRAGHHCAMPLHESLGIAASVRASFYFYNTPAEVEQLVEAVAEARDRFVHRKRRRR
ncbi:MAG: SufS family cysteine desulfurase [Planctomycetota bacterium]